MTPDGHLSRQADVTAAEAEQQKLLQASEERHAAERENLERELQSQRENLERELQSQREELERELQSQREELERELQSQREIFEGHVSSVEERLGAEMAHVRSLSQQLSEAETLNTALEEHAKAMQVIATRDWDMMTI